MGTKEVTEVRAGNVLKVDGVPAKVISHEMRGTGKFGKTVHLKLKALADGRLIEKSLRAEEKVEDVETHAIGLVYLYRDGDNFIFMNNETYEQFPLPAKAVGKQAIFLKEDAEVKAICVGETPVTIDFPRTVELKVVSAPPGVKGQADTTFKEVGLENGLKILAPQFVREGETLRVNTEDFSYLDRVTVKSLKEAVEKPEKELPEKP